jgi:hypothetical protein
MHDFSANPAVLVAAIRRLYSLTELRTGWNSYAARPIQPDVIDYVAQWIPTLLQSTPEPAIVPRVRGGIQLEWHRNGVDLEIYVDSPTDIRFNAEDLNSCETAERRLPATRNSKIRTLFLDNGSFGVTHAILATTMSVRVVIDIPDEIATQLTAGGRDLSRTALEALAPEEYRLGTLNQYQVGRLLGLSRIKTEDFLAEHADLYDLGPSELNREAQVLGNLSDSDLS